MKIPSYSVIIPTLNEANYIGALLSALREQSHAPAEVIVVDAGSSDHTKQVVESFPDVKWIASSPNIGAQRSLGGQQAQGDYLLFLDADTTPESNFAEQVLRECQQQQIDIACPWYWPRQSTLQIKSCYAFFNLLFWMFQWVQPSGAGSGIIVRRDVFQSQTGFRADLKFDDIEFIRRVGSRNKFRSLSTILHVSDRRFRKDGVLPTMATYFILSILFFFHLFSLSNKVPYLFGQYRK